MSIFDNDFHLNDRIKSTVKRVDLILNKPAFKWNKNDHPKPFSFYFNQYITDVMKDIGIEIYKKCTDLEKLELFYNVIYYIKDDILKKYDYIYKKLIDDTESKGILNSITKIIKLHNLEFTEITANKYKLITKDIAHLIEEISVEQWREQIKFFFILKDDQWTEKEKILTWFASVLTGDIRTTIESGMAFFNVQIIKNLFKDLNNIYKHFNNKKVNLNLKEFDDFKKLSLKDKNKKAANDMWLITYLLVEYSRLTK